MLPNTSVMLAPSTLMRVASFKAMEASTETPSRASIVCSASVGVALISSADASIGCRNLGRRFAIANLLEIPDLHAIAFDLEFGNVFLVDIGGARSVDEGREPSFKRDVHRLFVRHELRDGELGGRIEAAQSIGFEILARLQYAIDIGGDVLQQHRFLPVDRLRRYIEREIGDEAPHLLKIGAAHSVFAHPERLV